MARQRTVADALWDMLAGLCLMLGTDFPFTDFLPDKPKKVQVDRWPAHIGRAPTSTWASWDTWPRRSRRCCPSSGRRPTPPTSTGR